MFGITLLGDVAAPQSPLLTAFIEYVAPVLFSGLATALVWAFTQLGKKFGVEAGSAKKNQIVEHILMLAKTVVADLEVTMRAELKAGAAGGKLTPEMIGVLRSAALNRLKQLAGEKGLTEVQAILGIAAPELERYLTGMIEQAVCEHPANAPEPTPAPTGLAAAKSLAGI